MRGLWCSSQLFLCLKKGAFFSNKMKMCWFVRSKPFSAPQKNSIDDEWGIREFYWEGRFFFPPHFIFAFSTSLFLGYLHWVLPRVPPLGVVTKKK